MMMITYTFVIYGVVFAICSCVEPLHIFCTGRIILSFSSNIMVKTRRSVRTTSISWKNIQEFCVQYTFCDVRSGFCYMLLRRIYTYLFVPDEWSFFSRLILWCRLDEVIVRCPFHAKKKMKHNEFWNILPIPNLVQYFDMSDVSTMWRNHFQQLLRDHQGPLPPPQPRSTFPKPKITEEFVKNGTQSTLKNMW